MGNEDEWAWPFGLRNSLFNPPPKKFNPQLSFDKELIQKGINNIESLTTGKFLIGGYSGAKIFLKDGIVRKEISNNQNEYDALKLFNKNNFSFSPAYFGQWLGMDEFSYVPGTSENYVHKMPWKRINQLVLALKEKDTISKTSLKTQVYVHGDLSPMNVIFLGNQLQGIIDWNSTSIGEEYEDLIYVMWTWLNIGALNRDNEEIYEGILGIMEIYQPSKDLRHNFADKMIAIMEGRLLKTPAINQSYLKIFQWVQWSEAFVEEYRKQISEKIG